MFQLNQDLQVNFNSDALKGKKIALGISGSIAAVESVKLIRELRRHQAKVVVFPTNNSLKFITNTSLRWASKNQVVENLGEEVEHIHEVNLLLIAPATLNIINKIAQGIADDPLTTLTQSILGKNQLIPKQKIPIFVFPSMHVSLANNPILKENIKKLNQYNISFFSPPSLEENKLKIPSSNHIVTQTCHHFNKTNKNNSSIFITTGAVPSFIDSIRVISNIATGNTGIKLGQELYKKGFPIQLLAPSSIQENIPDFFENVNYFTNFTDYQNKCFSILEKNKSNLKIAIFLAAVSDFSISKKFTKKASSQIPINLKLTPNKKIIEELKIKYPSIPFMIFKLETKLSFPEIKTKADKLLKSYDYLVVNLQEELNQFKKYFFSKKESKTLHSLSELVKTIIEN